MDAKDSEDNNAGVWNTMRGQWGHPGFGRAHFGQRGWLRPAILRLLEEKPMNGMEMINKFYDASHGWWKPSPGSVYPLLETLEAEGAVKKKSDGRYELTKKFKSQFTGNGQVEEMITNMEGTVSYLEELSKSNKTKIKPYKQRIERLAGRISRLK
jgi:DNA-binding PadR family transcriptional regulator